MKKVLLASTALAFSAGWAMADVTNAGDGVGATITLSGEGVMGVIGNDQENTLSWNDLDDDDVVDPGELSVGSKDAAARFYTDVDLKFTMRGMTDGGLEFGVEVDLDEADNDRGTFDGEEQGGEVVWMRGAFGNLYMGDTDGAFDWAMQESVIGGTIGDINEHAGYVGNSGLDPVYDGQVARYDYTFGDTGFGVAVSANIDDFDEGDPVLGLGAKYAFAASGFEVTVGGGIQSVGDTGRPLVGGLLGDNVGATIWGISANMTFGAFQVIADYSQFSYDNIVRPGTGGEEVDDGSHWGIAVGYEWDAWLFAFNYGHSEDFIEIDTSGNTSNITLGDAEGYALTANYDLGGGATLEAGIAHNTEFDDSFITYSFGVSMAF